MENQLKTTELRCGNYVYFKDTKDIGKVELIHNNHFDCRDEYGSFIPNGNYEPIPLTEDILVKLGFEKSDYNVTNYQLKIKTSTFGYLYITKWIDKDYFIININNSAIKIQHLHQLQNLYFALCGEELTFKI